MAAVADGWLIATSKRPLPSLSEVGPRLAAVLSA